MSDNVGLSTPRGSGTSGYVQRNLANYRPRDNYQQQQQQQSRDSLAQQMHRQRQPDQGLLEHDRKREVEVKVFELRDKLEEQGDVDDDDIDRQCDELRARLLADMNRRPAAAASSRNLKMHQVHELADAKIKESERLRQALKISKDYEEGSHWRRQEERVKKVQERDFFGGGGGAPAAAAAAPPAGGRRDSRDSGEDDDGYNSGRDRRGGGRDSREASPQRRRHEHDAPVDRYRRDRYRDRDQR